MFDKTFGLVAEMIRRLPTMQETWVQFLGWEDLLEKEMATHPSILAWRIPWAEEPDRLQSMGSQRVRHDWATSLSFSFGYFIFCQYKQYSKHSFNKTHSQEKTNTIRRWNYTMIIKNNPRRWFKITLENKSSFDSSLKHQMYKGLPFSPNELS